MKEPRQEKRDKSSSVISRGTEIKGVMAKKSRIGHSEKGLQTRNPSPSLWNNLLAGTPPLKEGHLSVFASPHLAHMDPTPALQPRAGWRQPPIAICCHLQSAMANSNLGNKTVWVKTLWIRGVRTTRDTGRKPGLPPGWSRTGSRMWHKMNGALQGKERASISHQTEEIPPKLTRNKKNVNFYGSHSYVIWKAELGLCWGSDCPHWRCTRVLVLWGRHELILLHFDTHLLRV